MQSDTVDYWKRISEKYNNSKVEGDHPYRPSTDFHQLSRNQQDAIMQSINIMLAVLRGNIQ